MKRIMFYSLVAMVVVSSCRKDDKPVFDQSPDDRLNATLAKYQSHLSGAQNGWKAVLYPAGGGAYSFYFKFNDSNRVRMYSDFNMVTAVTLRESSFRLKALQQPSLIFDTYSYIHMLSDPNEAVVVDTSINDGPVGVGLVSDYEFYFDSTTTDTIKLVGRFNGSRAILIRATAQEAAAYNSGQLNAGLSINRILTYFKRLTIGSVLVDIKISPSDRTVTFTYLDASGNARTATAGYYYTVGGINFTVPVVIGNTTINGFANMQFNATTQTINLTVNNVASSIAGVVVPLKVDVAAPRRWWNYAVTNGGSYWSSDNGFHVNGVDDAYGVNSLVNGTYTYYYLVYWPSVNPSYDFFGPFFLDAARTGLTYFYGTAPSINFTADGRAIFLEYGNFLPYPTSGPAVLTRTKIYDAAGYYFVQTGTTTYDMVSASDGKSWITWDY